jgi:hypothetical protein
MVRPFSLTTDEPLLDLASYARGGAQRADRLSLAEIAQISRTVHRTPEVMVKVLNQGAQNLGAVRRHLDYIGRRGEVAIETDDGQRVAGHDAEENLLEDWDLDLDELRRRTSLSAANGRDPPKLVHKLMFSMPAGTPPDKVLAATREFAREHFALKHRYAMALHTDEPHPHVHMVVKAVSEQGIRLNIRKATLREWRRDFARHLRQQGVPANATERAVRGVTEKAKRDGIYRAMLRGESTYLRARVQAAAAEIASGRRRHEPGKSTLVDTRQKVRLGWLAVSDMLDRQGQPELAASVRRYVDNMETPVTEKERMSAQLIQRIQQNRHRHKDREALSR